MCKGGCQQVPGLAPAMGGWTHGICISSGRTPGVENSARRIGGLGDAMHKHPWLRTTEHTSASPHYQKYVALIKGNWHRSMPCPADCARWTSVVEPCRLPGPWNSWASKAGGGERVTRSRKISGGLPPPPPEIMIVQDLFLHTYENFAFPPFSK